MYKGRKKHLDADQLLRGLEGTTMPITLDRSICCDLNETISREWLITNGLGGYASGTVAGVLTRMQHGLLVISPRDTATPQLLLAKIDEEVAFDQRTYYLGTNEYQEGTLNPSGFAHLETFRLEEGFPIFTYRLGGIDGVMLEKRIWMPHDYNTTYIQYRVVPTPSPIESANRTIDWRGIERTSNNDREAWGTSYALPHSYPEAVQRVLTLTLLPFAAYRPFNQPQYGNNDWHFQVQLLSAEQDFQEDEQHQQATLPKGVAGCTIRAWDGAQPYHILAVGHPESATTLLPTGVWYWKFLRRHDRAAGLPPTDDLYLPGVIRAKLLPGRDSTLTIIVTAEELSSQPLSPAQLDNSYKRCLEYQHSVLQPKRYFGEGGATVHSLDVLPITNQELRRGEGGPLLDAVRGTVWSFGEVSHPQMERESQEFLRLLLQAGDRFLCDRLLPQSEFSDSHLLFSGEADRIPVLISSYYRMEDCTRDTLIALPGLTLATGHYDEARRLLRNLARYFKQGMLPDRLPTPASRLEERDYGSVDTTLWFYYALDHYLRTTHDYELLDDLYHRLADSIAWYIRGTYNGIQVDAQDGLLRAQQPGKALTWMNAIARDMPVTPRHGKAVEVNALWYHTLSLMHEWSQTLYQMGRINHTMTYYQEQSEQCKQSFQSRFWYSDGGYLYDVIDGPDGNDASVRPNQLLALSLRYPVLNEEYRDGVLELVTTQLLTPYGLRTLAPQETTYQGHVKENQDEQPATLHQGSAWPWLIGPYVDALLNAQKVTCKDECQSHEDVWRKGLQLLGAFYHQLYEDMLGNIASTFDGNEPYKAGGQLASAASVGEILRVYNLLTRIGSRHSDRALSV